MKPRFLPLLFATLILLPDLCAAEIPAQALGRKGQLILSDDFEREGLGPALISPIPAFTVTEGVLKGRQTLDDHGATAGATLALPDGNVILEVKFRFAGARSINIACDDKAYAGSTSTTFASGR